MDFSDIPQFPRSGFEVDIGFDQLLWWVDRHVNEKGLQLNPDFQRGHVWSQEQRIRYIEYQLRGGEGGKVLSFNHPNWSQYRSKKDGPYEIIDGLQRLTSGLMFMRGELRAFGHLFTEFTGKMRMYVGFKWRIFELPTREDVLQYYLDMNAGGTPHSEAEIERVRALLQQERIR
jgi:hypothetical protein